MVATASLPEGNQILHDILKEEAENTGCSLTIFDFEILLEYKLSNPIEKNQH